MKWLTTSSGSCGRGSLLAGGRVGGQRIDDDQRTESGWPSQIVSCLECGNDLQLARHTLFTARLRALSGSHQFCAEFRHAPFRRTNNQQLWGYMPLWSVAGMRGVSHVRDQGKDARRREKRNLREFSLRV